jgi:hypothetical protein
MAVKRLLVQTQLSNYDTNGKFILECDSGWQMVMGRVREMFKLNPELHVDVMGPYWDLDGERQLKTHPWDINPDLFETGRLRYIEHYIYSNALLTRYDFNFGHIVDMLRLGDHKVDPSLRYDAVYINDPLHLRNFRAMFFLKAGYVPKFYVHSHFIDNPECPKFPTEASLWMGQCEAARKADWNFWQCKSAMDVFFSSIAKEYQHHVVEEVRAKSEPWDDGYSSAEINAPLDEKNLRFDLHDVVEKLRGKVVIFVPNRIGGKGRSSDYTNCGKFMFEILPELRKRCNDFVVVCGNPSQKIFNHELEEWCGKDGYISLVPDSLRRDEFKFVARYSHIVVGLYDQDAYGGTAARECIELGCLPLWLDCNEYSSLAREAGYPTQWLAKPDFSNLVDVAAEMVFNVRAAGRPELNFVKNNLRSVVRKRCSYESTTPAAMQRMGLL